MLSRVADAVHKAMGPCAPAVGSEDELLLRGILRNAVEDTRSDRLVVFDSQVREYVTKNWKTRTFISTVPSAMRICARHCSITRVRSCSMTSIQRWSSGFCMRLPAPLALLRSRRRRQPGPVLNRSGCCPSSISAWRSTGRKVRTRTLSTTLLRRLSSRRPERAAALAAHHSFAPLHPGSP